MKRTAPGSLFAWGGGGLALSVVFHILWEQFGRALPGIPWPAVVGMLLLAAALLILGWPIRRWREGDRSSDIDLVQAARVAMLAKAASMCGSGLTGWYLGAALYLLVSAFGVRAESGLGMLVAAGAAGALMVVGIVVEGFCTLPPDDRGSGGSGGGARSRGADPTPA